MDDGIARIEQGYTLDFAVPAGELRMNAEGDGSGLQLYGVAARTLRSSESGFRGRVTFETVDGVVEVELSSTVVQQVRPAPAGAR